MEILANEGDVVSSNDDILKTLKEVSPQAISDFLGQHYPESQSAQCWKKTLWAACGV